MSPRFCESGGQKLEPDEPQLPDTVNMVIFAGGKFPENVGKTFHVGVIFRILILFPS